MGLRSVGKLQNRDMLDMSERKNCKIFMNLNILKWSTTKAGLGAITGNMHILTQWKK